MQNINELPVERQRFLEKLYQLISSRVATGCPTLESIRELWREVMEPICAPDTDSVMSSEHGGT